MKDHCRFHPERRAVVVCEKFGYGYCEECLKACTACTDPELFCRHRSSCIIWELCRKTIKRRRCALAEANRPIESAGS